MGETGAEGGQRRPRDGDDARVLDVERNEMTKPKKPKLRRSRQPPRRTLYAAYSAAAPFTLNVHVSFDIAPALG